MLTQSGLGTLSYSLIKSRSTFRKDTLSKDMLHGVGLYTGQPFDPELD